MCPRVRFVFSSGTPSKADGARGRMRTALKSTVCSAYGSNDDCHTLGSHTGQIYGWEAPFTTLVYTTHIHSTCEYLHSTCEYLQEYASTSARLPGPPLPCQPSFYRPCRLCGWSTPCTFPELLGCSWDRAAVEILSAVAAADLRVDPRRSDRPTRRQGRQLPLFWPWLRWW